MSRIKTHTLAGGLLVAVVLAGFAAACGAPTSTVGTATTPAQRAERILGHAPTGLAADIVAAKTMVVVNDAEYPPQSSIDEATGDLSGFDVDVARRVGRILGLSVAFRHSTREAIPVGLEQGKYDVCIGSMAVTAARESTLDFTEPYYYSSAQVFVRIGGRQIAGARDLRGRNVGAVAGTTYLDYLRTDTEARVVTYQTDTQAFADLAAGKLDFLLTGGQAGQQAILSGLPVEFSGAPFYYEDLAFAVKQGEADWLALLDHAVQRMHEDGSLAALSKRWFNGMDLTVKQ